VPDAQKELSRTAVVSAPPPAFDPALDAALDEALMETFPASDPVAISRSIRPPSSSQSSLGRERSLTDS
jgi:hypothetical protein